MRVASAASGAWYRTQGGSGYETAAGVVAALALIGHADPAGPDPAAALIASSDEQITAALAGIWSLFQAARPELARLTGPLASWVSDDQPEPGRVHAIADVARAAAECGLLHLAGTRELRDTDVTGITYQQLRARAGAAPQWALGEFPTPPGVCTAMAAIALSGTDLKPGMSIAAGPAGTGEMLRAAAGHIREQGMDPAGFWWIVNGISPAAVAVTAVNCHLRDLGPHVVIGVADPAAEPGWAGRAWAEQQAAIARRDAAVRAGTMLVADPEGFRHILEGLRQDSPSAATRAKPEVEGGTRAWTARTQGQLVAALARKGWSRDSARDACHRAVRDGAATTMSRAGDIVAIVTFSNTEVGLWDAEIKPASGGSPPGTEAPAATLGPITAPGSAHRAKRQDPRPAPGRRR